MATTRSDANRFFVVPWRSSADVQSLYNDIFVADDAETRRRGLGTLKAWKYRMSNFYSVGLSATLALLEADDKALDRAYSPEDLQVFYASAFNRFLNFAHSLTKTQSSMYGAAKELGISSFIVDVRHLCSHGTALPSLETFRMCSRSCKDWLRLFFWDNLLKEIKCVPAGDLPAVSGGDGIAKELDFLLEIYDFTAHQLWLGRRMLVEVDPRDIPTTFTQYAKSLESDNLMLIRGQLLKDCSVILEDNRTKLATINTFCHAIMSKLKHFLDDPQQKESADHVAVTVVHQNFFHMIANLGIVGEVLRRLLTSSHDPDLGESAQHGASFWAGQILKTCWALRAIRAQQQKELKPEELLNVNWESINTKSLDRTIERAFAAAGLQRNDSLIFGVSKKNTWAIKFSRDFTVRQIKHTNPNSREANKRLLTFVDPPLSDAEKQEFIDVIDSFVEPEELVRQPIKRKLSFETSAEYTVREPEEPRAKRKKEDWGIWSCPDEGIQWEKCPIGSAIWHIRASS